MIQTAQATCRADTGHKHLVQSRSGVYFLHIRPGLMFHDLSSTSNIITLSTDFMPEMVLGDFDNFAREE